METDSLLTEMFQLDVLAPKRLHPPGFTRASSDTMVCLRGKENEDVLEIYWNFGTADVFLLFWNHFVHLIR